GVMAVVNGVLYFQADDGAHGHELWRSDGTAAGTWMVKDINPGATRSNPEHLTAGNGVLYFDADDGGHGNELGRSDGTAAGTSRVKDITPGAAGFGYTPPLLGVGSAGVLYFRAGDGVHGNELWRSDGTTAGTVMVKDINLGAGDSVPSRLTDLNGVLYFAA